MNPLWLLLAFLPQSDIAGPIQSAKAVRRINQPLINELVASNDATLADEDGDFSDWIEIRNAGPVVAELDGWFLTDNAALPTKWMFPPTQIPVGGYLIVFASGKDRAVSGAELHTNFKLKASGEFLALVRPDGFTPASAATATFPALAADQAYGAPGDTAAFTQLNEPTPMAPNSGAKLPEVAFSEPSGLFQGSILLVLSAPLPPGSSIRYTLDGTEPTDASPIYRAPLSIHLTTRVRARVGDALGLGAVTQRDFTLVAPDVLSSTSTLPLVVVDTFGQAVVDDENQFTDSIATFVDRVGGVAALSGPSDYHGPMALRIRGSSSAGPSFLKKSYRTELRDASGADQDADLLGLGAESDWVLYAPGRIDRNMIANPMLYGISETLGLDSVGTQYCELYLNRDGGSVGQEDYEGIYVLIESIKIGPNRLDLAKLASTDIAEPNVTGGYIFSVDRMEADEYAFHTADGFPHNQFFLNIVKPGLDKLVPEQIEWVEQHFDDFEDALFGPNFADPLLGYGAFLETPSWIDMHIMRVLSMDPDALVLSNFFYKDRNGKFIHAPLWDVDRTMDSDDNRDDHAGTISSRGDKFAWEWWDRLFQDPAFRSAYSARWFELRKDQLSNAELATWVDSHHQQIAEAYPREDARWGSEPGYGSRFGTLQGEMDHLKAWLDERLATLDLFCSSLPLENVARYKSATQSSTEDNHSADLGCDGQRNSLETTGSIILTAEELEPWWEVDLGQTYSIDSIRLSNRWPSEPDVASNFHLLISDTPFAAGGLAAAQAQMGVIDIHNPGIADSLRSFPVGATGRYVRIQLEDEGTPRRLSFAELEVLQTAR